MRPSEVIPFAQQIVPEAPPPTNIQEGATEESRLRKILKALKVGGVSGSGDQRQVLLGPLILKPGNTLPKILSNQIEVIRVVSVNNDFVVLEFVNQDPALTPRQLSLPLVMKPVVRQIMSGEAIEAMTKSGGAEEEKTKPAANPPDRR